MRVANTLHPFFSQILISLMMSLVKSFFLLLFHFRYTNLSNFPFLCDLFLCFFFFCLRNTFPSLVSLTFHFYLQIFINFYIWLCVHKTHLELILSYKGRIYVDILPFPPPLPKIRPLSLGGRMSKHRKGLLWDLHWDPSPSSQRTERAQRPRGPRGEENAHRPLSSGGSGGSRRSRSGHRKLRCSALLSWYAQ